MKFYYLGRTRQREEVNGSIEAQDEIEARIRLRAMQIRPTRLTSNKPALNISLKSIGEISLGSPVSLKQIMIFTRQFSSLIDSGVPVVQCLDILWQQEKKGIFKNTLLKVKEDIESGSGLADSLALHPKIFSDFFVRIVEAGEISGTLDKALRRVGAQLEKLGKLRSKVIGALTYPAITMVVAVVVLIFLLVKVVPEIAKLYSSSSAQLPEITVTVLALSEWLQANYLIVVGSLASVAIGASMLYKVPQFREVFDPVVLKVPLIGALIRKASIARLTRTLSTLISSGVPLLPAFAICARLMDNLAVKASVNQAATFVSEGKTIAAGLSANGLFPPMVIHMVNIGEMTGKLDELLGKVADIYDDEVDEAVGQITGLLQPALIVIVGLIVAVLLLAMYLPIFQLADKTSGGM